MNYDPYSEYIAYLGQWYIFAILCVETQHVVYTSIFRHISVEGFHTFEHLVQVWSEEVGVIT